MRNVFEEELSQLKKDMISMGALCEDAIRTSTKYLMSPDTDRTREIADMVEQVNHKEREIENLCLKLLMQQQPVARDLRVVSSALKMVSDLERIGDNADDIAEIISMGNIQPRDVKDIEIFSMADAASHMLSSAIDSFVRDDETIARAVIEEDDTVDDYFNKIKSELAGSVESGARNLDGILDLFMIAKYFERIGDHSVNVAQWVVFMITGVLEGNTN